MGVFETLRKKFMSDQTLYPPDLQETNGNFGPIPGIDVFASWRSREEMRLSGMHKQTTAGISGNQYEGAYSIVVNGGYVDDSDEGDFISYTGAGGTAGRDDPYGGERVHEADQSLKHPHNKSLLKSAETGRPVRVIRGSNLNSKYAPKSGYRYDGLYKVIRTYETKGREGFNVCKFELRRLDGQPPLPTRD